MTEERSRGESPRIDSENLDYFAGKIDATIASFEEKLGGCHTRLDILTTSVDSLKDTTIEGFASVNVRCKERLTRIEKLEKGLKNRCNGLREESSRRRFLVWSLIGTAFVGLIVGLIIYAVGAV